MSTPTTVERLKKLEAEAKELRVTAKKEALAAVKAAIADLNSLGFSYVLTEGGEGNGDPWPRKATAKKAKKKAAAKKATRQKDPNKQCDICGYVTDPPHDARKHRGQGETKKAFTAKDLENLGLAKKQ